MTDLERFLSNRNADADTWVDDEGLHVHDWDTDRCLLFDANEKDFHFICIYIHALRTLSVFGACLAETGYYPDLYINDKSPDVRKQIICQYPKQCLKRMHNYNDRFAIRWELVREPNPDLEVLSAFLETVTKSELKEALALNDIDALRLKHPALITNPSPIEKTMAPYQLFEIHNPLWTLHYTAIAVFNITNAYDELEPEYKQMDNCVKLMFEIKDQLINAHASNLRAALRRRLGERT